MLPNMLKNIVFGNFMFQKKNNKEQSYKQLPQQHHKQKSKQISPNPLNQFNLSTGGKYQGFQH